MTMSPRQHLFLSYRIFSNRSGNRRKLIKINAVFKLSVVAVGEIFPLKVYDSFSIPSESVQKF